jgi:hypothetical protein
MLNQPQFMINWRVSCFVLILRQVYPFHVLNNSHFATSSSVSCLEHFAFCDKRLCLITWTFRILRQAPLFHILNISHFVTKPIRFMFLTARILWRDLFLLTKSFLNVTLWKWNSLGLLWTFSIRSIGLSWTTQHLRFLRDLKSRTRLFRFMSYTSVLFY